MLAFFSYKIPWNSLRQLGRNREDRKIHKIERQKLLTLITAVNRLDSIPRFRINGLTTAPTGASLKPKNSANEQTNNDWRN